MSRFYKLLIPTLLVIVLTLCYVLYYNLVDTRSNIMNVKVLKSVSSNAKLTTVTVTNHTTSCINTTNEYNTDTQNLYDTRLRSKILAEQSCIWIPADETYQQQQPCYTLLTNHMRTSLNDSYTKIMSSSPSDSSSSNQQQRARYINRRWILLGDSTVYHLYAFTHLQEFLMHRSKEQYIEQRKQYVCSNNDDQSPSIIKDTDLQCRRLECNRCNRVQQLGTIPNATVMNDDAKHILPSFDEGPLAFGLENPSCTDCSGCETGITSCYHSTNSKTSSISSINNEQCTSTNQISETYYTGPAYGGFITIEFARDVEIQSQQYTTTQENIIHYFIQKEYNTPSSMIKEFGKPICIVNTGQHDMGIPNITKEMYVQNMIWYLELLNNQCDYILYISNTSPLTDLYEQTKQKIYEWNIAVRDILFSSNYNRHTRCNNIDTTNVPQLLHQKSFFLDVYNASLDYLHHDNVHMATSWYVLLATFLSNVMNTNFGVYEYV